MTASTLDHGAGNAGVMAECSASCPPGQGCGGAGEVGTSCVPCEEGFWSSTDDTSACTFCTPCNLLSPPREYASAFQLHLRTSVCLPPSACTQRSSAQIPTLRFPFSSPFPAPAHVHALSPFCVCHKTDYHDGDCTASSDTVCVECTTCGDEQYRTADCTDTTDTVCEDCQVCPLGKVSTHMLSRVFVCSCVCACVCWDGARATLVVVWAGVVRSPVCCARTVCVCCCDVCVDAF